MWRWQRGGHGRGEPRAKPCRKRIDSSRVRRHIEARGGELEEHVALRKVSATVERGHVSRQRQLAGRPDLVAEACRGGPAPPNQQFANDGDSRTIEHHVSLITALHTACTDRTECHR